MPSKPRPSKTGPSTDSTDRTDRADRADRAGRTGRTDSAGSGHADQPIAIIGIGCKYPKARDLEAFWANIREGVDGITETPPTHWRPDDYYDEDPNTPDMTYGRRGGFLDQTDFDPLEFGISPRDVEATDTAQLLGLAIAKQALQDAGYPADSPTLPRDRTSVVLGVTGTLELVIPLGARLGHPIWRRALRDSGVDPATSDEVVERIRDSYVSWQENSFPGLLGNVVAGRIANRLDLHGTNCVVDAACASSLSALHLAMMELRTGRADLVVSGGVDTFNDIFMYMCFSKTPALSPTGDARPFAAAGDGTILGEGLGMVVLKRLAEAERDGDRIYAVVRGIGASSDGKGNAVYAPSADGQARALRAAYRDAAVDPGTIELVEAHGTGTKVGDATEIRGLTAVYSDTDRHGDLGRRGETSNAGAWCALGSVKSMIGHTKAAAGAAGLIKAAMALHHRVLPPTLKVDAPNEAAAPGTTPFYINTEKRPWLPNPKHPRRAGVSAFGFGGSNFHCVLEEYDGGSQRIDWDGRVQLLPLSAHDRPSLRTALENLRTEWPADVDWTVVRTLAAKHRANYDPLRHCRLVIVLEQGQTSATELLRAASDRLAREDDATAWQNPLGIWFGAGPSSGTVGALFPGQGSQYPGMLRDLVCRFPAAQDVLANANAAGTGTELSDHVYPHPAFDDATRKAHAAQLRRTDIAQPAIGAVSLGALEVLRYFGIEIGAAAGHSYGELTALRAAGRLSEVDLHTLSWLRGKFMARGDGDRGRMLAVFAERAAVDAFLVRHQLELVIANRNAPEQFVLSGPTGQIEATAKLLRQDRIACKLLPVAAAFHSALVAEATAPFGEQLRGIEFAPGTFPVFANTTADPYPDDVAAARQLLAGQLAAPVEFQRCLENMRRHGVTTFVEIGPGNVMSGLVEATLGDDPAVRALAIDASRGRNNTDLCRTLAGLLAAGHPVHLARWDEGFLDRQAATARQRPAFTVPIGGANYVAERAPRPPVERPARTHSAAEPPSSLTKTTAPPTIPGSTTELPVPDQSLLAAALQANQQSLQALAQMQQQTADLHRQFLDAQEQTIRSFEQLIARQQQAFGGQLPGGQLPTATVETTLDAVAQETVSPSAGQDRASEVLLAVVADKTGYPAEMLELSMGLDADLGIDSIKRVEILSALQEQLPAAPIVKPEHLGELQTLGQIVDFLSSGAAAETDPPGPATNTAPRTATPIVDHSHVDHSHIESTLLEVVADKTGYPAEMLELSMGLDADLGIDSIKRVEILSALQERLPDAPVVKPEHLGELSTLGEIVAFLAGGTATATPTAGGTATGVEQTHLTEVLVSIVADKTGYPAEMLELSMGLDADLGIDSIKRVEILAALQERLPDAPVVKPEHLGELQTLGHIVDFLAGAPAVVSDPTVSGATESHPNSPVADPVENEVETPPPGVVKLVLQPRPLVSSTEVASNLPAEALIWVTRTGDGLSQAIVARLRHLGVKADEIEPTTTAAPPLELAGLVIVAETDSSDRFLQQAFALTRHVGAKLRAMGDGEGARLATVSRLDGRFGLGDLSTDAVLSGGLAGLTKTASHEWPQVDTLAIDLDHGETDHEWTAKHVVAQFLRDDTEPEVGICRQGVCALELLPAEPPARCAARCAAGDSTATFTKRDVVILTGGARGVTAEVAIALAKAYGPRLVLLGRSDRPTSEPDWLGDLDDEVSIKKAILREACQAEPDISLTPRELADRYHQLSCNREMLRNIARMEAAGADVTYYSLDVRDRAALGTCIATIKEQLGPIKGLIHGAGVLADSYIIDKSDADFERVLSTKVDGARALLDQLRDTELAAIVMFSSSTARFGRTGQADYAIANEVLNKLAQREQRRRPTCRVVAVNWGPWNGGMVTPALRTIFAGEGIQVIDLVGGSDYLLDELAAPAGPVEIVILGQGSTLPQLASAGASTELPAGGSLDNSQHASVVPTLSALPELPTVFERALRVDNHEFLQSHVLDHHAVLPVAMMIEWLGHAALHGNPGLRFRGVSELRVLKGVVLDGTETRNLRLCADRARKVKTKSGTEFHVATEFYSTDTAGHRTLHARATVRLGTSHEPAPAIEPAPLLPPYPHSVEQSYIDKLFHGHHLQGLSSITGCSAADQSPAGIISSCNAAPSPAAWMEQPVRSRWIADPLAIDGAFQSMILWTCQALGRGSLPTRIGSYRQFVNAFPAAGVRIEVRVGTVQTGRATADIDWLDAKGQLIARMTDYECVIDESLSNAFTRNELSTPNAARR